MPRYGRSSSSSSNYRYGDYAFSSLMLKLDVIYNDATSLSTASFSLFRVLPIEIIMRLMKLCCCAAVTHNIIDEYKRGIEQKSFIAGLTYRGNLYLIKYVREVMHFEWDGAFTYHAAENGQLDCLKYAVSHGCPLYYNAACAATKNNHFDCLVYIAECDVKPSWDPEVIRYALIYGRLDCLVYAVSNGCPWCSNATSIAATYGNLDCLVYIISKGCPWSPTTTCVAAYNGNLDCLAYAAEHGCHWHPNTTCAAAEYGHLDCLVYAAKHGCPWHPNTTWAAAEHGHLDCLVYAAEHGCPWHPDTTYAAEDNGHSDCLAYVASHR